METSIFEYLKNKKALFEVRHYIIDGKKNQNSLNLAMANKEHQ